MHTFKQRRQGPTAQSGFTILETVIALFIALVIGFGAISLFLFSASFNAGASDRARALALAQEKMEELRATTYANLAAGDATVTVTRGSDDSGEADLRSFSVRTQVVNDTTTTPTGRQKTVTVTVTPAASEGRLSPGGVTLVMVRASDSIGSN